MNRVWSPVRHLQSVLGSKAWRDAYNDALPLLTEYGTELSQNARLQQAFARVKTSLTRSSSDAARSVVDHALRDFHLAGVDLPDAEKSRFKAIMQELAATQAAFEHNIQDASDSWVRNITDHSELAGVPEHAVKRAADEAQKRQLEGWALTLDYPTYDAVMTHADNRELRRELYRAWSTRASDQGESGEWDNSANIEKILALLDDHGRPLKHSDIVERLNVQSDDSREILRRRLKAMVRDGQLIKNRRGAYGLPSRMDLVPGRISAHPDGYGFVMPDDGESDLYLSPRAMRTVLHGDRVLASVVGVDARGRREGAVREILERAHSRVVGHFVEESGIALVVPDDKRINQDILLSTDYDHNARQGDIVLTRILEYPDQHNPPIGMIESVLGKENDPGMEVTIALPMVPPLSWPSG